MSGEYAGQGRSCTCCESRYDLTVLATCGRALSCWNTAPGNPCRKGIAWGGKTLFMYRVLFKLPTIRIICDHPRYAMEPQTITPGVRPL
ncbi:hypothetical protein TNCV_458831 [Trichonephila clavipes]|nr:hypothetical protein TNCV_458831 [Trichonephila clavipes]